MREDAQARPERVLAPVRAVRDRTCKDRHFTSQRSLQWTLRRPSAVPFPRSCPSRGQTRPAWRGRLPGLYRRYGRAWRRSSQSSADCSVPWGAHASKLGPERCHFSGPFRAEDSWAEIAARTGERRGRIGARGGKLLISSVTTRFGHRKRTGADRCKSSSEPSCCVSPRRRSPQVVERPAQGDEASALGRLSGTPAHGEQARRLRLADAA